MKKVISLILVVLIVSCSFKNPSAQVSDDDLLVMAQFKKVAPPNTLSIFMVRIFPDKRFNGIEKLTQSFFYHADSCFYLLDQNTKVYPEYVEPVMNGVKGSYEFLVGFDNQDLSSKEYKLIYQDQFINKKKYVLIIK